MSENNNPTPSQNPASIDPNSGRYVPRPINWERELLEKLAMENLIEQRRKRRWGIFFKLIVAFYVGFIIFVSSDFGSTVQTSTAAEHTALVELKGVIDSEGAASAERINTSLKAAFDDKRTVGVILRINSPGGSPVQGLSPAVALLPPELQPGHQPAHRLAPRGARDVAENPLRQPAQCSG